MKPNESDPKNCRSDRGISILKKLAIAIGSIIIGQTSFAQTINSSPTWNGVACKPFVITVTATGGTLPFSWTTAYPGGFPPANDPTGWLTVVPSTTGTLTINANPPSGTEGVFFLDVTVDDATPPSNTQQLVITISRPAYDLMFVLDRSGSMTAPACATCSKTRYDVLSGSMEVLYTYIKSLAVPDDQIGIVYFDNVLSEFSGGGLKLLSGVSSSALTTDLTANVPGFGSTAMGAGLQKGMDYLIGTDPRHIILLSDGIQNVNPMVNYGPPVSLNGVNLDSKNIKIHTIAIGTGALADQMAKISAATGGRTNSTTTAISDVDDFFTVDFIDALRGCSPALVVIQNRIIPQNMDTVRFEINKNVKTLIFNLKWIEVNALMPKVLKDGVDLTQYGTFYNSSSGNFITFSINLPVVTTGNDTLAVSEGNWELDIRSRSKGKYKITVLADDHFFRYKASLVKPSFILDDTLKFMVNVSLSGMPVADTMTVRAVLLKPGDDLGTLLATTSAPNDLPGETDALAGEKKFEYLIKDPSFADKLVPNENDVFLTRINDSTYAGWFAGADLTGAYNIAFFIDGNIAGTGKIHRMDILSAVVNFGNADLASSNVHTIFDSVSNMVYLSIKPQTASGLLMGPLNGNFSIMVSSNVGMVGKPIDKLDGTYLFPISGISSTDKPVYTIHIGDQLLHEGQVTETGPVVDVSGINLPWWLWLILILIVIIIIIIIRLKKKK